jgi:short-chain fatty acids transporter
MIEAATKLDVSHAKTVMALAYGDQLTNMLQPFWALPLLAITGLKAKDILPYTLFLLVLGLVIFSLALAIF